MSAPPAAKAFDTQAPKQTSKSTIRAKFFISVTMGSGLFTEPEVHHVAILHHILFGFEALLAGAFCLRFTPGGSEVFKANDFSPNKPLLQIGVNSARGFQSREPFADWPRTVFFSAYG